jgi:hypothetical protein
MVFFPLQWMQQELLSRGIREPEDMDGGGHKHMREPPRRGSQEQLAAGVSST